jgi:uncharacterized MAPEG superfamily protein
MPIELKLLVCSAVLGLLHLIAASHLISWQRGYRWTASDREAEVPPLRGLANRVDQACTNFLETFPIFASVVLVAYVTNRHTTLTVLGAQLYFWARIAYVLAATLGWSLFRSVICWNAALTGILLIIAGLSIH